MNVIPVFSKDNEADYFASGISLKRYWEAANYIL